MCLCPDDEEAALGNMDFNRDLCCCFIAVVVRVHNVNSEYIDIAKCRTNLCLLLPQ